MFYVNQTLLQSCDKFEKENLTRKIIILALILAISSSEKMVVREWLRMFCPSVKLFMDSTSNTTVEGTKINKKWS